MSFTGTSLMHGVDFEEMSTSIQEELEEFYELSGDCCIYRVPKVVRQLNESAYTPQLVSIGPFHHGKEELKEMEEHKRRYLKHFLKLSSEASIKDYLEIIKDKETQLRNCYAEIIWLRSEEFVKMILFDAAFIIMVLLKSAFNLQALVSAHDLLFVKTTTMLEIRWDMLLLENQIPFFILEDLFNASGIQNNVLERWYDLSNIPEFQGGFTMIKLTNIFFKGWVRSNISFKDQPSEVKHLLDFLRILYSPSEWHPQRKRAKTPNLPCIGDLQQAGIKFKAGSKDNIFDIKFENGVLEIPSIILVDETELLLRNLQAYERCHNLESLFADYIVIMDQLVSSARDVDLLVQKGILENWAARGTERTPALFHNLSLHNLVSINFTYSKLMEDVNEYCAAPWPKWKATWNQKYFNTPWAIFSVIAAALLLVLTLIQTVCSILQVT